MIVYPAIDIRDGRCVRLVEGDFARETVFLDDPADAARRWHAAGASWLHVVDLDAARSGTPVNVEAVRRIRAAVPIPIQYGGGLRTLADIETMVASGIDRAVLGSAAVHDDGLVSAAVDRYGDRIAVGLDARDGLLAADGWLAQTRVPALDRALAVIALGVTTLVVTDIRRDGTGQGPNVTALAEMVAALVGPLANGDQERNTGVIASGGVGSLAHLEAVAATGAAGVIVGTALYDGRVDLAEALALARSLSPRADQPSGGAS